VSGEMAQRIARIKEKINDVCLRIGRDPGDVRLMAVSKLHPLSAAEEAWENGIRLFGENRVQEGIEKFSAFRETRDCPDTEIHFIGNLQRNKAKKTAEFFDCIQSVDRETLLDELGMLTEKRETPLTIFLEYHTGEESKAGFPDLDSLFKAAEKALSFPGLKPAGLMTMAPLTDDAKAIRASFRSCMKASEALGKRFGDENWSCLSMGMTNDFEIAIEEGSTLVRIGTAIFGERL